MKTSYLMVALAASSLAITTQAGASVIIDDFFNQPENGAFPFASVEAYQYPNAQQLVATGSSSNGTIIGGERDVRVEITDATTYQNDNDQAAAYIGNGRFAPYQQSLLRMYTNLGAEALFSVTYDGLDGSPGAGPGLGFNAAAAGNTLRLQYFENLVVTNNDAAPTSVTVRLTDANGRTSSLARSMPANVYGVISTLNYGFSDFEAANNLFDISSISMIVIESLIRQESSGTGVVSFSEFRIDGAAYTPINTPGGASEVPEPAVLGLFGLCTIGLGLTRRRRAI